MSGPATHPAFAVRLGGFDWIEANAGSGKTWTITALVARAIVEREADPRGIVVVTFTRAAAAELRTRIRGRLADLRAALEAALVSPQALAAVPDAFARPYAESIAAQGRERLERARRLVLAALASIDEMTVSTIHGFAQRLLSEFGPSLGAPDDARFGVDLSDLMERLQADFWRAQAAAGSGALVHAIGADCRVMAAARRRLEAALRQPAARLQAQPGDAARAAERWQQAWRALGKVWPSRADALVAALDAHPQVNRKNFQARYVPSRRRPLDALRASASPWRVEFDSTDDLAHFASVGLAKALKPGASLLDPALLETVEAIDRLHAAAVAFWDEAPDMLACAWRGTALAGLDEAKRRAQRFDHDDALRLLAQGLDAARHTDLAARIAARHPFLFVDEAQDTDPLQWSVIERIWLGGPREPRHGALVAVGDPKQAIYAFRDADVYAYLAAKERWRPELHTLADNRRSTAALVQGVNALCSRGQAFVEARIDFAASSVPDGHDAGALLDAADPPGEPVAPLRIARFADKGDEVRVHWTAREIARLLDASRGARIRAGGRDAPVRPGDIGVLVRTAREGARIRDALRAHGIGSVEVSNASVLDGEDAQDLQDVIAALAWPDEPMRVRGALATPLLAGDCGALLDALESDGGARRAVEFRALRRLWLESGPLVALRRLAERNGTAALLAALPDGERRLANLHHLIDLLQAAMPATRTPQAALAWLAAGARRGVDDAQLRLDDDASLVRISTIHKSKGLEYPIVFVPFAPEMGREPSGGPDSHDYPVWHDTDDGLRAVIDLRTRRPESVDARVRHERAAEQVRLAYVALTRARLRCVVGWTVDKAARKSPFAWLLHGIDTTEKDPPFDVGQAESALAALQAAHPGRIAVARAGQEGPDATGQSEIGRAPTRVATEAVPNGPEPGSEAATSAVVLAARAFRSEIARPLDRLNFTALQAGLDEAAADGGAADSIEALLALFDERDRDESVAADASGTGPVGRDERFVHDGSAAVDPGPASPGGASAQAVCDARDVRWRFPAGRRAGACLHEILEAADPRAGVRPADCEAAMRRWGYVDRVGDAPAVAAWLDEVLAAPLPLERPFAMGDADARRLLREFEFQLPVHTHARVLQAALKPFGPVRPLEDRPLHGTLRGFVDAVFEHDGRLWLLDWKSTLMGVRPEDYAPEALAQAMQAGGYRLQAALYAAATVRWMRARRPGWDAAQGFGGAIYVFLRGAGAQPGVGIHIERPDPAALDALIDALDATTRPAETVR